MSIRPKPLDTPVKRLLLAGLSNVAHYPLLAPWVLKSYATQFPASNDIEILVRDYDFSSEGIASITKRISEEHADVVAFSTYIFNFREVFKIAAALDSIVVVGGPQVTNVEQKILAENPAIDLVVTGEGERPFVQLLEYFHGDRALEGIPGVTTRSSQGPRCVELVDMDVAPSVYPDLFKQLPGTRSITIETSRGCPYTCKYCVWSASRKMRFRDVQRVLSDFDVICGTRSVKWIYLADSSLFLNKKRAKTILRHLIDIKAPQRFLYELKLEHVDDELAELMGQLPHQEFSFGIQAVDREPNEVMTRTFDPDLFRRNYSKLATKLPRAQLSVDIMYPLPGDSLAGFKRSLDFGLSLEKLVNLKMNPLILLPGSQFFDEREQHGVRFRDESLFLVGEVNGFPAADVRAAVRYGFYAIVLHSLKMVKEALTVLARKRNASLIETAFEFFENLPVKLFREDHEFIEGMRPETVSLDRVNQATFTVVSRYSSLLAHLKAYSDPDVNKILAKGSDVNFAYRLLAKLWLLKLRAKRLLGGDRRQSSRQ